MALSDRNWLLDLGAAFAITACIAAGRVIAIEAFQSDKNPGHEASQTMAYGLLPAFMARRFLQ